MSIGNFPPPGSSGSDRASGTAGRGERPPSVMESYSESAMERFSSSSSLLPACAQATPRSPCLMCSDPPLP